MYVFNVPELRDTNQNILRLDPELGRSLIAVLKEVNGLDRWHTWADGANPVALVAEETLGQGDAPLGCIQACVVRLDQQQLSDMFGEKLYANSGEQASYAVFRLGVKKEGAIPRYYYFPTQDTELLAYEIQQALGDLSDAN